MAKLNCTICKISSNIPKHCGQEMHIEEVHGKEMLVCWMGPKCGKQEIPSHCNKEMTIQ